MSYVEGSALRTFSKRSQVAIVAVVATAMLASGLFLGLSSESAQAAPVASVVDQTYCYGLDEGTGDATEDQQFLHEVVLEAGGANPTKLQPGAGATPVDAAGNIESIALRNDASELYVYDPFDGAMFVVDTDAATESAATDFALAAIGDIDAMFFQNDTDGNPANDILWVLTDVDDGVAGNVDADTLTGYNTAGAQVAGPVSLVLPVDTTVEGATWVPDTGEFLISYTTTAAAVDSTLASLGTAAVPSSSPSIIGTTLIDVEGLGTDGAGAVFLTTGEDGANADNLYHVDETAGAAETLLLDMAAGAPAGGDADFESIDCAWADITLDKAITSAVRNPDGTTELTYTFTITNTGELQLADVTLVDPMANFTVEAGPTPDDIAGDCSTAVNAGTQVLNIGASCTAVWIYTVSDAPGDYDNTATVTGTPPNGIAAEVSSTDTVTATIPAADQPVLEIVKTVVDATLPCPAPVSGLDTIPVATGEQVKYCIVVTNSGTGAAAGVTVADDLDAASPRTIGDLAAGASSSYDYTVTVGANPETNTAIVSGTDIDGVAVPNASDQAGTTQPAPGSISNFVFNDLDGDGVQDPGEAGIQGVTVNLWSSDGAGNPVAQLNTTTTDANGEYIFSGLDAGDYVIEFVAIDGRSFSPADQGGDDAADSDPDPANGITGNIALAAGEDDDSVDAGLLPLSSISNFVFQDTDGDGIQDAGEPGIQGVTVNLWSSDGAGNPVSQLTSTTTDANGEYVFPNLAAGDYVVEFVAPAGRDFSPADQGGDDAADSDANPANGITSNIALGAGEDNDTVDAGILPPPNPGSISNFVFEDTNSNGIQDGGEPGIQGVTVNLWSSDGAGAPVSQLASTTTDANGEYVFPNLAAGDYVVEFVAPGGRTFVGQDAGVDDTIDSDPDPVSGITGNIALAQGENNVDVDAGLDPIAPLGSISNFVFEDTNGNDLQDAGEPGVQGVTVNLWTSDGAGAPVTQLSSTTTDANGEYIFPNLAAGDYVVQFQTPRTLVGQDAGVDDTIDSDPDPVSGITGNIALAAGENNVDVDAGVEPFAQLGSISNFVWVDDNDNGLQDAGEAGIQGVTVNLWTSDGAGAPVSQLSSTTTDANGEYIFSNLNAGDYVVEFVDPTGRGFVAQNVGVDDTIDSDPDPADGITDNIALAQGENNTTVDAGINPPAPGVATIGNFVWHDLNRDGIQDAGEPGVPGVTINVWETDAAGNIPMGASPTVLTTDANGEWTLDVTPGDYRVNVVVPTGFVGFTTQDAGADDAADSDIIAGGGEFAFSPLYTVADGETNLTIDAGVITLAELGNFVFEDTNGNGIQDAGEPGIPGIVVQVLDAADNVVGSDMTDANGEYLVTDLQPGTYTVSFINTTTGMFTTQNAGVDDTVDSDADATGLTAPVTLGPDNLTVDAGIVFAPELGSISNFVWVDSNSDGIQDAGEPGIQGVTVNLWTSDGAGMPVSQLSTTTTDAMGEYIFPNLVAGDYVVEFVAPGGRTFTAADQGADDAVDSDANPANGITGNIALGAGEDNVTVDAGILPPPNPGSISNFVFEDTDGDGIQDAGEPGIQGVTVNLWSSDGAGAPVSQLSTTTTDANGEYVFPNLAAGDYVVEFVAPGGRDFSPVDQGGDDAADSDANPANGITGNIALGASENNDTVDAGILPLPDPGSISNFVFEDTNGNGIQDAGEPGIPGVTVTLWTSDGAGNPVSELTTTTTDANGEYVFPDLAAGDFVVQFVAPADREFSPADQGADDAADSDANPANGITGNIALGDGENNDTVDAGILPPPPPGSISNVVFEDTNENGIQDAGEPGVPGVQVVVRDDGGAIVGTDTTDANGAYLIDNLAPGDYTVQFILPDATYTFSPQDQGADDSLDSDPNASGMTGVITLAAGENNVDIDAGVIIPPNPVIGLAKDHVGMTVDGVADQPEFDGADMIVTYSFVITNLGDTPLTNIVLTDDFDATFAGATVVDGPTPNGGDCSAEVAAAPGHSLAVGESCNAVWTVTVQGWPLVDEATYINTATVTGTDPDGTVVTDISDDGVTVDADGDGNPNEPGENDPTPITINPGGGGDPIDPGTTCTANNGTVLTTCSVAVEYPGPFNNSPEMTPVPAAPATAEPLAFTGSSANLLATLALALMGAGGALMIGARRRNEDD